MPYKTLQKERRVQQRKERQNPPQTTKKVSNHKQKKNIKTCENFDPTNLELSYTSFNNSTIQQHTTKRKAPRPHTERTLTVNHSCHRTRLPFGHVLIERTCGSKHCKKREWCNNTEKKNQTHHHKQQQQGPVSNIACETFVTR